MEYLFLEHITGSWQVWVLCVRRQSCCTWICHLHHYRPQTKFAKVMFLHLSVILFRGEGGGCLGPGPGGVSAWGCQGPGLGWGVQGQAQGCVCPGGCPGPGPEGCPGPGPGPGGCPGLGCVSQHVLRQTTPSRWLLLWTVRILLECILVLNCFRIYSCLSLAVSCHFWLGSLTFWIVL